MSWYCVLVGLWGATLGDGDQKLYDRALRTIVVQGQTKQRKFEPRKMDNLCISRDAWSAVDEWSFIHSAAGGKAIWFLKTPTQITRRRKDTQRHTQISCERRERRGNKNQIRSDDELSLQLYI